MLADACPRRYALPPPVPTCCLSAAPSRAHQAPFYARGLQKIIAVSENAPGAHRDVPRDAGVSRFAENGSYPAATDAAEGHAGHVDGPGNSGNAGIGSHLAGAGAAKGHAGQVDGPGSSGNAGLGSYLAEAGAAEGLAGHVGGPGSSGNTGTGSHPAGAGAAEGHAGHVDDPGRSGNSGIGSHLAGAGAMWFLARWCGVVAARPQCAVVDNILIQN